MSFDTHANALRAPRRVGTASLVGALVALVAGLLVSAPAQARGDDRDGGVLMQQVQYRGPGFSEDAANERALRQAARAQREQQMQGQRPQQNDRAPEPAAQQRYRPPEPNDARAGRPGRMTPEERRALRQQIDEAGRDVYRDNPRR